MIYPPPRAGTDGPRSAQGKDPDRQLAMFLVVMAIATAALFYAADVRVSGVLGNLGLTEALGGRFGATGPVTSTLEMSGTPNAAFTPDLRQLPLQFHTPVIPTFDFGGAASATQDSGLSFPTPAGAGDGFGTLVAPGRTFPLETATPITGLRKPGDFAPSPTATFASMTVPTASATTSAQPIRATPTLPGGYPSGTTSGSQPPP